MNAKSNKKKLYFNFIDVILIVAVLGATLTLVYFLREKRIVTSDNSRSEDPEAIIADIIRGIDKEKPHIVIPNRRDAIEYAIRHAGSGEIILLCGKGHEKYEIDREGVHPFDEKQIVAELIGKIEIQKE